MRDTIPTRWRDHAVIETPGAVERRELEEKVADVMRQLRRGEATVVFDMETSTVNIVVAPVGDRQGAPW